MSSIIIFFFFNDTATTEIYTLSLHDALPISRRRGRSATSRRCSAGGYTCPTSARATRSEEHTSELQSQSNLVCRLLLEKKKRMRTSEAGSAYAASRRVPTPPSTNIVRPWFAP